MRLMTYKCRRAVAIMALPLLSLAAFARPAVELTPEQRDMVNRNVAIVISSSLDPIITNLQGSNLPLDKAEVGRYIAEILGGKDFGVTPQEANAYVESVIQQLSALSPESQEAFLKQAASQPGAITLPSGVVFQVIVEGEGIYPTVDDSVFVKYVGRFSDGTVFDNTGDELVTFDLQSEIPGFVEGLKMMKPGGTYRLVIPADQAYGAQGIPGIIPGNAALDFTVTLDSITPSAK